MKNIFFFLICSMALAADAQTASKINKPLADSISSWAMVDQTAARKQPTTGPRSQLTEQQWRRYQDSVFAINKQQVEAVFNKYGFPGYDLVGQSSSYHFWLIVQHCDKWPHFQERVLASMKQQLARKNANPRNFAYLQDDVLLNTGRKQLYATQVTYNTTICQAYPKPLADSLNVDKRRKEVGLEPLREYLNELSEAHFLMNRESYKQQGITKPVLYNLSK